MKKKVRILHVISGLGVGGAEMMLYKLLSVMDKSRFDHAVLSLKDKGPVAARIEGLAVPVHCLWMDRLTSNPLFWISAYRHVRRFRPDLIQGWMYHGNLAASFIQCISPNHPPMIWNVRHSVKKLAYEKPSTRIIFRIGARYSVSAARIIYNSQTSMNQHNALGYARLRQSVFPNGFDIERFKPSDEIRSSLRNRLKLNQNILLIGHVARYHPMKNHAGFIRAAREVLKHYPDAHIVMVGRKVGTNQNPALAKMIESTGLSGHFHLMGECADIANIMPGIDLFVSSSAWGEAFPNTLGEAMACGLPCVVTDVGDCAQILDGHGIVVPPGNTKALAKGILNILSMDSKVRGELGMNARQRVINNYSISAVAKQYQHLYGTLAELTNPGKCA